MFNTSQLKPGDLIRIKDNISSLPSVVAFMLRYQGSLLTVKKVRRGKVFVTENDCFWEPNMIDYAYLRTAY